MSTLFYVITLLFCAHSFKKVQSLVLEALTPCILTASGVVVVQAYCEETITPCTLTASNGAIVHAYCEPSLVSQPFVSITAFSALQNATGTTSTFQLLRTSASTVRKAISWFDRGLVLNMYRYLLPRAVTPPHRSRPRVRKFHLCRTKIVRVILVHLFQPSVYRLYQLQGLSQSPAHLPILLVAFSHLLQALL